MPASVGGLMREHEDAAEWHIGRISRANVDRDRVPHVTGPMLGFTF